jgi:hypothetical protein
MCHVSVGHVARLLEEGGIATVIAGIRAFRPSLEAMTPPRVLVTPYLMGRTLGAPGDRDRQCAAVVAALELLKEAKQPGTFVELPDAYRAGRGARG